MTAKPMRVCIVTPAHLGSNPRVVKEAQALHEAGHRVKVIATRTHAVVEPRDEAILRCAAWEIERLDLRSKNAWRARRAVQLVAQRIHAVSRSARFAGLSHSAVSPSLKRAALAHPADLYIAHYPAALPAAAAAAHRHGAAFAYDAEDFFIGEWPDTAVHDADRARVRDIERTYLPACAYVSAASPGIARGYARAYGIEPPTPVLNAFPLAQAPARPTRVGANEPGPSLYWFSQTIGPDRGLECAVRAIGAARTRPHLTLRGWPADGYLERLSAIAEEVGVSDRLHILPPDMPAEMVRLAADHDVGLCGEPSHTRLRALCVSNKLLTFVLAGVPPLMSATPGQIDFATEAELTDLIYPVDGVAALAERLDLLLGNPDRLAGMRAKVWRLGQGRYNWEHESIGLRGLVARALHA